jgi:peroxiredoxin
MRVVLAASVLLCSVLFGQEYQVGSKVADFTVTDASGTPVKFSSLRGDTTVLIFVATQCPVSNAYNERMKTLYNDYSGKGVKFVFVNANSTEPATEVEQHATSHGFAFPVYKDNNNVVADKFGAQVTPETYVIDKSGVLRYHGYIDDSKDESKIQNRGLRTALDAVMSGGTVAKAETKAFGCTIKRGKKVS